MAKHLNPLEKEFLIKMYRRTEGVKVADFCEANGVSEPAFRKWMKQYDEGGIEGLNSKSRENVEVLPEGVEPTMENLKKEVMKLRIENERLKKNYTVTIRDGERVYIPLKQKNSK